MDEVFPLAKAFLAGALRSLGTDTRPDMEALEAALRDLVNAAERAFPNLGLKSGDFVKDVAAHLVADSDPVEALRSLHAADLYLACACSRGIPAAIVEFERVYLSHLPGLERVDSSPDFADEVRQVLREKLFVAASRHEPDSKEVRTPGRPKIADYSGRGNLAKWVRVVALRTSLNLRRSNLRRSRHDSEVGGDDAIAEQALPDAGSPELAYLKSHYKVQFAAAFRRTLAGLNSEERSLLRFYYLKGIATEKLAALFHTSRSSISRRLSELREQIFNETRRILEAELGLTEREFESLAAAVRSQLDLSINSILKTESSSS